MDVFLHQPESDLTCLGLKCKSFMTNNLISCVFHSTPPVVCQKRYARCCFYRRLRDGAAERGPCIMKETLNLLHISRIHVDTGIFLMNLFPDPEVEWPLVYQQECPSEIQKYCIFLQSNRKMTGLDLQCLHLMAILVPIVCKD